MTPAEFLKIRRLEVMRQRLRRQTDPHLTEMRAYKELMKEHNRIGYELAARQTDALEVIAVMLKELVNDRTR